MSFQLLNPEQIAERRIPTETAEVNLQRTKNWHCHYCNRRFMNELTYLKHHCESKRRAQEIQTPVGQAAFNFYRDWMRARKFSQQGVAAFMESKFYRAFINFAELVVDAGITRPDRYIALMVEHDMSPVLWCRSQTYAIYIDYMDKLSSPEEQLESSLEQLMKICEREKWTLSSVYERLGAAKVLLLLRQRKISPWLIFSSPAAGKFLKTLNSEELKAFRQIINAGYWQKRFKEESTAWEKIKRITREIEQVG